MQVKYIFTLLKANNDHLRVTYNHIIMHYNSDYNT